MTVHGVALHTLEHPLGFPVALTARFAALHRLPDGSLVRLLAELASDSTPQVLGIVAGGIRGWRELDGPALEVVANGRMLLVPARTWIRVALRLWGAEVGP
jgi:protein involved in temperature-dependent protein secretion